jgi:hypothetical protein
VMLPPDQWGTDGVCVSVQPTGLYLRDQQISATFACPRRRPSGAEACCASPVWAEAHRPMNIHSSRDCNNLKTWPPCTALIELEFTAVC